MDRASVFGTGGRGFESLWARLTSEDYTATIHRNLPHSSRGLGRSPLKAKTGVRISYGAHPLKPNKIFANLLDVIMSLITK